MKIAIDAMGGDNAPAEIVRGAIRARNEFGYEIVLVGRAETILQVLKDDGMDKIPAGVEILHAEQVVEMEDDPAAVTREKKQSSMIMALDLLASGDADAMVSAGNTGALLSASTLRVKRVRGIRRAALAPVIPTSSGGALLIDCGANVECTPEYLLQFAYMGAYYVSDALGRENPRVGLLNIGAEQTKGGTLQKESYKLLRAASDRGGFNFIGNIEGRDVTFGVCDVIVSDGFSGNIMLKSMEGMGLLFADALKGIFMKNAFTKLAALLVRGGLRRFKESMNYKEAGGAPLLGISRPVIKAHGSSDAYAMRSAIRQAANFAASGVCERLVRSAEEMKASSDEQ